MRRRPPRDIASIGVAQRIRADQRATGVEEHRLKISGDVILEINRHPVQNADDAVAQSERIKGKRVLLRVWTHAGGGGAGTRYIVIEPPKER